MALAIHRRINALIAQGSVELMTGRIRGTAPAGRAIEFTLTGPRGESRLIVDRGLNCTGIHEDYANRPRSIIRALIESGLATCNETGLGFRTGDSGGLIGADGRESTKLFTLGPPRRGDLFETTAVPEIRRQAEALAPSLLGRKCSPGETCDRRFNCKYRRGKRPIRRLLLCQNLNRTPPHTPMGAPGA